MSVSELSKDQASAIYEYAESDECDWYVATALRSMIDEWEGESGECVSGEEPSI